MSINDEIKLTRLKLIFTIILAVILFGAFLYSLHRTGAEQKSRWDNSNTNISVITTINWNDVSVKYNIDNVRQSHAQNIFKYEFERYGSVLQEMTIQRENDDYEVTLSFQDGTTKKELLSKK